MPMHFNAAIRLLDPLRVDCMGLTEGLRGFTGDRLTHVVARWKGLLELHIRQVTAEGQRVKVAIRSHPDHSSLVAVQKAVHICLKALHRREEEIRLAMPAAPARPHPLLEQLHDIDNGLTDMQKVLQAGGVASVEEPPALEEAAVITPERIESPNEATLSACVLDFIFLVPVWQTLSELTFTVTWCGRKMIDLVYKSFSWNLLKTAGAILPTSIATTGLAVITIPLIIFKKVIVDWPRAFTGIFKPYIWAYKAEDGSVQTKREASSEWLHTMWTKLDIWADSWIDWIFDQA